MPFSSHTYQELLDNNREWVANQLGKDPQFFANHAKGQAPPFLFIGCSDSRMPLDVITKSKLGELFIHRNVANQVSLTDMNVLSVLDYAVNVLKIAHIIICGHTNCGGVDAAISLNAIGIVENWIMPIRDLYIQHKAELDKLDSPQAIRDRLSELNVLQQVKNISKTSVMHNAFAKGDCPQVHGWIFDIHTGLIRELE